MTPDGQAALSNPLYAYVFLDAPDISGIPPNENGLPNQVETVRHWDPVLEQSNQTAATAQLLAYGNSLISYVYNMFTMSDDYPAFSHSANSTDQSNHNIEYIHGGIHVAVGGDINGTMTNLPVAGFDPIFYLHHANVDRLIAMWQALNPSSFIEPSINYGAGTYYEPSGSWESGESSMHCPPR
jgi:tyrosinase